MRYLLWMLAGAFGIVLSLDANTHYQHAPQAYKNDFHDDGEIAQPDNRYEYNLYDRERNQESRDNRQEYYYYQFKEGDNPPQFRRSRNQQQQQQYPY